MIFNSQEGFYRYFPAGIPDKYPVKLTNGCFDILHRGHIQIFRKMEELEPGINIVAINSDASIKRLKGPARPFNNETDRALLISMLRPVSFVIIFDTDDVSELITKIKPNYYIKGGDYNLDKLNDKEKRALQNCGASIHFAEYLPGLSTTSILDKINDSNR